MKRRSPSTIFIDWGGSVTGTTCWPRANLSTLLNIVRLILMTNDVPRSHLIDDWSLQTLHWFLHFGVRQGGVDSNDDAACKDGQPGDDADIARNPMMTSSMPSAMMTTVMTSVVTSVVVMRTTHERDTHCGFFVFFTKLNVTLAVFIASFALIDARLCLWILGMTEWTKSLWLLPAFRFAQYFTRTIMQFSISGQKSHKCDDLHNRFLITLH